MTESEVEFLLVPEVAKRLRVSDRTVYRLIDSRQLAATRVGAGRGGLRVRPDALVEFVRRREQTAACLVAEVVA
ncbi:helix-turn-helix domain-containing protein [Lentzea cavernae]|uniref:Helix-turn-helix domain-containing protein n=1 Tax=Lentzea cavernae TaxID=2020703 RepID=A0ABQ3N0V9_9PSEU|nr:helix-turn-helix domain-containing protein [Lentzea cavernae]GHH57656.1 hypothetical protein GCM10017774_77540 [Lentzea cavernae]